VRDANLQIRGRFEPGNSQRLAGPAAGYLVAAPCIRVSKKNATFIRCYGTHFQATVSGKVPVAGLGTV
jgi:hypothetical protein